MKKATIWISLIYAALYISACQTQKPVEENNSTTTGNTTNTAPVWQSETYTIYRDSVVQRDFVARVLSPAALTSNYQSPANEFKDPRITFKFAINGRDNEMASGTDHHFSCIASGSGTCDTPLITFGRQLNDTTAVPGGAYLTPNTKMKVRLDLRPILEALEKDGFYTTATGDKIYKEDFRGVYIAGSTDPLSWDFDNLEKNEKARLTDADGDGVYEIILVLNAAQEEKQTAQQWTMTRNTSAFAQYQSDFPIADALYNLALEEMMNAVEPDSTFRTGKEWAGVWTRDISYSIILSMAQLQPQVSRYSLMRKVKEGRIIQDTGTGGAYPVSSDRMIWAVAAWEVYKVTGDAAWLQATYQIIKNSLEDDYKNVYNPETGLVRGESSFLDWREQTYPRWMEPADIYESENLGTNAVHYQANMVASQMATLLNDNEAATNFQQVAGRIREGINKHLWQQQKGYYGQYLYGRNYKVLSPRAEALGEALSVLFGVADAARSHTVVARTPITNYGIPSIYPQIPGIPPYHNNGMWPFVQSYWSLAAAKAGNEKALLESMSAIYRPAALFLTNKENFVASNGDYAGTQINSINMLWSLAGSLSMVYKVLFGMNFEAEKLVLQPFVPQAFAGTRKLTNYKYRNAVLNLEMSGYGNQIASITLNGEPMVAPEVPAALTGSHTIKITLANNKVGGEVNHVPDYISPQTPQVTFSNGKLSWPVVTGAVSYQVFENGEARQQTESNSVPVQTDAYTSYMVQAIDQNGVSSFCSEPVVVVPDKYKLLYELENYAAKAGLPYRNYSGSGFVEISRKQNTSITIRITVPESGLYAIDFRYANGNGPINTENKAAIRTLKRNGTFAGTIVLPQRGTGEWNNWGYTNAVAVPLQKGTHSISLTFEQPTNQNMHGEINQAMADYMRVVKIR